MAKQTLVMDLESNALHGKRFRYQLLASVPIR